MRDDEVCTVFEVAPPLSRTDTLDRLNRPVNEAIAPRYGEVTPTDPWLIAPRLGWCHDYAVTKRWLLLALGFKPAELLLCECIGPGTGRRASSGAARGECGARQSHERDRSHAISRD
jgi:hypothetical protein